MEDKINLLTKFNVCQDYDKSQKIVISTSFLSGHIYFRILFTQLEDDGTFGGTWKTMGIELDLDPIGLRFDGRYTIMPMV